MGDGTALSTGLSRKLACVSRMNRAIIGQPTEMESDIVKGAEQSGDEVCVYAVCDELGGHRGKFIPQEKTNMQEFVSWSILDLVDRSRDSGPDLVMRAEE